MEELSVAPINLDDLRQQFLIAAATAIIEGALTQVDVIDRLLKTMDTGRGGGSQQLQEASKGLPADDRRALDELVKKFRGSLPEYLEQAQNAVMAQIPTREHNLNGEWYPRPEEEIAGMSIALLQQSQAEQDFHALFGEHQNEPSKLRYLNAKFREEARAHLPEALLSEALLPAVISALEEYLKSLLRFGLRLHPTAMGALPSIPSEFLARPGSQSDLQRWAIDQKVSAFISQGPEDWRKQVLKWPKLDLADAGADWSVINEAIQRRHVIIHNGGRADARYIDATSNAGRIGEGEHLSCDLAYMQRVLLHVKTLAIVLGIKWVNKLQTAEPEDLCPSIRDHIIVLELAGAWRQALAVSEAGAAFASPSKGLDTFLANKWFCMQELGLEDKSLVGEIYSWSSEELMYKIARAALLRDEANMLQHLRELKQVKNWLVLKRHIRTWPLAQRFARDNAGVKKALER